MSYKYVDLGTKRGGALDVVISRGPQKGLPRAARQECLGIDKQEKYRQDIEAKGYNFEQVILPDATWSWPEADVYLAWNFLEHLPNLQGAQEVIRSMIEHSSRAVWLFLPSFEEDIRNRLQERGFDLPWWHQPGHHTYVLKRHVREVLSPEWRVETHSRWPIKNLDPKTLVHLPQRKPQPGPIRPYLIGAWELILWRPDQ